MGRLGWIALTGAAMMGGVLLHSEDVRGGIVMSEGRFEDKADILEERMEELGERIERGDVAPDEIGDAVEDVIEEVNAEVAAATEEAERASQTVEEATDTETAQIDDDARQRIDDVTAQIDQLREDNLLTQEQYSALIAQLSAEGQPEQESEIAEDTEEATEPAE